MRRLRLAGSRLRRLSTLSSLHHMSIIVASAAARPRRAGDPFAVAEPRRPRQAAVRYGAGRVGARAGRGPPASAGRRGRACRPAPGRAAARARRSSPPSSAALLNPLRHDRTSPRFPNIVQDAVIVVRLLHRRHLRLSRQQPRHGVGGERHRRRLRAAGHARQRLCRPRHPDREAVPRRPLDSHRRSRGPGAGGDVARDQAAHPRRHLRHRSQQHHLEGTDHQLLGADRAGAAHVDVGATYLQDAARW